MGAHGRPGRAPGGCAALRSQSATAYLRLLPVLALVCGLFLFGLALALIQSLGYLPALGMTRLTLAYYQQILGDPILRDAFWPTLRVAALSTIGACLVGTVLAVCLAQVGRASPWLRFLTQAPLALPHLVAGYMILMLLAPTGLLARILQAAGLLSEAERLPSLVYDGFGWGIVLAYIFKEAPFAAVLIYPLVGSTTRRLQEAAATLGASPWQAFRHVVWPLIWPGVLTAGLIIFAFTMGAFEIPYVLGSTYPRALPVLAYQKYTSIDLADRPVAMALAMILTALTLVAAWGYLRLAYSGDDALGQVRRGRDD